MEFTIKFLVLIFGLLLLANVANAETPREQLRQMVEQLQQNPGDSALREKIIQLARQLKPEPTMPSQALKHEIEGLTLLAAAKTQQDYLAAEHAFQRALSTAPWQARLYFALGETDERLGDMVFTETQSAWRKQMKCDRAEMPASGWYRKSKKWFSFYKTAMPLMGIQEESEIFRRIAEREMNLALWKREVEDACCLGCGGIPSK